MRFRCELISVGLLFSCSLGFSGQTEKVNNDKVVVYEDTLSPGENISISGDEPALILYLDKGTLEITSRGGTPAKVETKPGEIKFEQSGLQAIRNNGPSEARAVLVKFKGQGLPERWGATGLSKHYKVLIENNYARVYDIFIPASSNEPQHTHKNRIVVCLAGAELTHLFPDGRTEVSSLKTGEIVWRKGSTHIGQNHSSNDFHAVAIEPK